MRWFSKLFSTPAGEALAFHPSQTCPECGSRLCAEGGAENWHCPNPDCPAQVRRSLVHWCSAAAMDIPGGDEPMVALLVKRGLVRDIAELYRLKLKELAALPGIDPAAAQKFFDALTTSMKREAWRVIFGLGIPHVGAPEAQALGKSFAHVDIALSAGAPRLVKDAGLSEAAAQNIVRWYGDGINRKMLKRLEKYGVNLKSAGPG